MARRAIRGSRAIVTGASSGIGWEIALELARQGGRLVLVARREEKLAQLANLIAALPAERPLVVAGDITDPGVRQQAVGRAQTDLGGLDILVNNAGIGALGRFEDATPERLRQIMEVNFFAAAEMIRTALPVLKQGQKPIVVNVGSILGCRAIPLVSEYCASKFALHGLSESLRAEFGRVGIDVLVLAPGTTQTEFDAHRVENRSEKSWPRQRGVSAAYVARRAVTAMRRGQHVIIPNPRGKLLCFANRLAPRLLDRLMARYG